MTTLEDADERANERTTTRTQRVKHTFVPSECPREGCDEERYSQIGMEFHLLRDHEQKHESA